MTTVKINDNILRLPRAQSISSLGLDVMAFQKVFFLMDWGWRYPHVQYTSWDEGNATFNTRVMKHSFTLRDSVISPIESFSEQDLEMVILKFNKIKDYVSKTFSSGDTFGSDRQKILNRLKYQEKQYEKLYYKRHDLLRYMWLRFLEMTVNFGYRGELAFIRFCAWIIFIFGAAYRLFFAEQIRAYVNGKEVRRESDYSEFAPMPAKIADVFSAAQNFLSIDFIKCLYISFCRLL